MMESDIPQPPPANVLRGAPHAAQGVERARRNAFGGPEAEQEVETIIRRDDLLGGLRLNTVTNRAAGRIGR